MNTVGGTRARARERRAGVLRVMSDRQPWRVEQVAERIGCGLNHARSAFKTLRRKGLVARSQSHGWEWFITDEGARRLAAYDAERGAHERLPG